MSHIACPIDEPLNQPEFPLETDVNQYSLEVQRDGQSIRDDVVFTLVGTMNPEEGGLRPQLLDRFGLTVNVATATTKKERLEILENVLKFEDEWVRQKKTGKSEFLERAKKENSDKFKQLEEAKKRLRQVNVEKALERCVALAEAFQVEGNRGERVLAMAARARAALDNRAEVSDRDLKVVAPLALQHRRMGQNPETGWSSQDEERLEGILGCE